MACLVSQMRDDGVAYPATPPPDAGYPPFMEELGWSMGLLDTTWDVPHRECIIIKSPKKLKRSIQNQHHHSI